MPAVLTAIDVNSHALAATSATAASNNIQVDCVKSDMLSGLLTNLQNKIDILIFNPPYNYYF